MSSAKLNTFGGLFPNVFEEAELTIYYNSSILQSLHNKSVYYRLKHHFFIICINGMQTNIGYF